MTVTPLTRHVKVRLPGETFWAEVLEVLEDGKMRVKVANVIGKDATWREDPDPFLDVPVLHGNSFGDILTVEPEFEDDGDKHPYKVIEGAKTP